MKMIEDEMALVIDGYEYRGWKSIALARGLSYLSSAFSLGMAENTAIDRDFENEADCEVYLGSDLVLSGGVERIERAFDVDSHRLAVGGRSKTRQLEKSSVNVNGGDFANVDLEQISRTLANPFGVEVLVDVPVGGAWPKIQVEGGETCFDMLDRLARERAILLTDNITGNLKLTRATHTKEADDHLEEGVNIKSASHIRDTSSLFGLYVGRTQAHGTDFYSKKEAAIDVEYRDLSIPENQIKVIMMETGGDRESLATRVDWEARRRFGESQKASVKVVGWRQSSGALWEENTLVWITSKTLRLNQEKMLISSLKFSRSLEQGTITELTLTLPEAWDPDPPKPEKATTNFFDIQKVKAS